MSEPAAAGMAEALRLADDIVPGGQAIHLCSRQADHNLSTALVEEFLTGVMTIAHSVIVDPDAPNEAYFAVVSRSNAGAILDNPSHDQQIQGAHIDMSLVPQGKYVAAWNRAIDSGAEQFLPTTQPYPEPQPAPFHTPNAPPPAGWSQVPQGVYADGTSEAPASSRFHQQQQQQQRSDWSMGMSVGFGTWMGGAHGPNAQPEPVSNDDAEGGGVADGAAPPGDLGVRDATSAAVATAGGSSSSTLSMGEEGVTVSDRRPPYQELIGGDSAIGATQGTGGEEYGDSVSYHEGVVGGLEYAGFPTGAGQINHYQYAEQMRGLAYGLFGTPHDYYPGYGIPAYAYGAGGYSGGRIGGGRAAGRGGGRSHWRQDGLGSPDNWHCLRCGNENWPKRQVCNRCQVPRRGSETMAFVGAGGIYTDGRYSFHHGGGAYGVPTTAYGGHGRRRNKGHGRGDDDGGGGGGRGGWRQDGLGSPDNWHCAGCGNENWPKRLACNRCQLPRQALNAAPAVDMQGAATGSYAQFYAPNVAAAATAGSGPPGYMMADGTMSYGGVPMAPVSDGMPRSAAATAQPELGTATAQGLEGVATPTPQSAALPDLQGPDKPSQTDATKVASTTDTADSA